MPGEPKSLRRNAIAILALILALSGGYAIAATTSSKTLTACANKKTGELFFSARGRCTKKEKKVTWNQQGPQGIPGATGATGASAISVWANVAGSGGLFAGQGVSVQHVAAGTYHVTVTAAGCASGLNAPTVTVSDANPPNGQPAGAFPTAWIGDTGANQQFTVYTGVVVDGLFTATDHTFNLQDACS